jgi:hypothetical protein
LIRFFGVDCKNLVVHSVGEIDLFEGYNTSRSS